MHVLLLFNTFLDYSTNILTRIQRSVSSKLLVRLVLSFEVLVLSELAIIFWIPDKFDTKFWFGLGYDLLEQGFKEHILSPLGFSYLIFDPSSRLIQL